MCFGSGFGFTRWKGFPVKSKSFCSDIIHNMHLHPHNSFSFKTQLIFIKEDVYSKPTDEISTISLNRTFPSPPSTDLVLPRQFTDDFTTEPSLLLHWCQQSFPKTATTPPRWHGYITSAVPVEAVPTVPQMVTGLPQSSVTHPFLCSPLHPPAKQLSCKRAQPNPLQSNKPGWQSLTI